MKRLVKNDVCQLLAKAGARDRTQAVSHGYRDELSAAP